MDIVKLQIPYSFVRDRVGVSWQDMEFGLVNELLDEKAPGELAVDQIESSESPSPELIELVTARARESTLQLVEQLARAEPETSRDEVRAKWTYIVLAWIFENRRAVPDTLQRVEEVYADFGYPEQVAAFVRYMPLDGADLGTEANEHRLFERWKAYLDAAARQYRPLRENGTIVR